MQSVRAVPGASRARAAGGLTALTGVLAAACLVGLAAPATADDVYAVGGPGLPVVGHGYGHGHGLGQWGAQGAALQGVPYQDILGHYYPGTVLGPTPAPSTIRVLVSEDTDNDVTVRPDAGLAVAAGASRWLLPAGPAAWRIVADPSAGQHVELFDGAWRSWTSPDGRNAFSSLAFGGPAQLRLDLPGGGGRTYRGTLTAVGFGGSALRTVDTVSMEQYLWGVVPRESSASWQPAALQAQAVAARTYAAYKRGAAGGSSYDICATTACQVYGGAGSYGSSGAVVSQEPASTTAAVNATAGRVLLYGGRPAFTEFSASTGGWNAYGGVPYLAAGPDPWDDTPANPVHTWTATLTAAALQAAYPTVGTVQQLRVTGRDGGGEWGGRITSMVVVGSAGSVTTTGSSFAGRLGLRSPWWSVVEPAILAHWRQLGGATGLLGAVVSGEYDVPGGRAQDFAYGRIYWSGGTGANEANGLILLGYLATGGPAGVLGLPRTDEQTTPDTVGRYNHFTNGSIYFTPGTGAQEVHGAIRAAWAALGWERSPVGYPTTGEWPTPDGRGRFNHFENGSVYWSPTTGAQEVHGAIRATWRALGWEQGAVGYPTTGELGTPDGVGRFNHFQNGSIYFTPATGAHEVGGAIGSAWAAGGWERGALGYPTSDEYAVSGGRRGDFEHGSVTWDAATGAVTVTPMS